MLLILLATLCCSYSLAEGYQHVRERHSHMNTGDIYLSSLTRDSSLVRRRRQSDDDFVYYYATKCGFGNLTSLPEGVPYIEILGVVNGIHGLYYGTSTLEKAATIIHRMVRFMPWSVFDRLAANSKVGLFNLFSAPVLVFPEFKSLPPNCYASCDGECQAWCTGEDYPHGQFLPIDYLWAYGDFPRTFVVESNVMCDNSDPQLKEENLLVREYGLTVLLRGLDLSERQQVENAYLDAIQQELWEGLVNYYDYFMKATSAWFFSTTSNTLSGMNYCQATEPCTDPWQQRKNIKDVDPQLYHLLTNIYNNGREFINGDLTVC